jgi:TRAP-type C4-dicarboxylate transport system permease small subunit
MQRISDRLNLLCEIILVVILSAMAVVVFLQVLFRYLLHLPLFWTEEFARYCLVWASLLGAAVALKRGEHIAVTFFLEQFSSRIAGTLTMVARISVGIILTVMTWGGINLVVITSTQISPALRIPMAVPYMALPVGSVIMLFHVIASIAGRPSYGDGAGESRPDGHAL